MYVLNRLIKIPALIMLLILFSGICHADVEGTIRGTIRMYLYEDGTGDAGGGIDDIYASLGDTISVEVWLHNVRQEPVTQISLYFTVDSRYFDVLKQEIYPLGDYAPFIQREFMSTANPQIYPKIGNYSAGDKDNPNDNGISGWQLDYIEQAKLELGKPQGASTREYGTVCTFQLIAKAVCDSATITLDDDHTNNRFARYDIRDANDSFYFRQFRTCYITVSGATIDPPLPDIVMAPGTSDSTSLDLDDHINLASIPDSLFNWSASGNTNISVSIDSLTHQVTFTTPAGYRGYENITFTVGDDKDPDIDSAIMRVTSGYAPEFYESTFPDTIYIYEDSLQVVFNLWSMVEDKDDAFEALLWEFATGGNVTASKPGSSLILQSALNYNGEDYIEITVRDVMELEDTITRPIWVYPVNDPPTLSGLPDAEFERTQSYEFDMSDFTGDVDNDPLTVNYDTPDNFIVDINGMMVTISEVEGYIGSEDLIFMVSDPQGLSASDTMRVVVTPLKGQPEWSKIPKIGFPQNQSFTNLILWDYVDDPDGDVSELTFEFSNYDDVDSTYVSPQNGRLYLYDLDDTPGWDIITVKAIDYDMNEASTEFLVFIGPADGTPIVAAIPDTTIRAGTVSEWIDLDDYYYDVDNNDNEMVWTMAHAEAESLVTVDIDPLFRTVELGTVYTDATGSDRIIFTVTDPDDKFASDDSIIKVLSETKPILDMPAKIGFVTGTKKTINLDDYAADPDFPNSDLEWSWHGNVNIEIEYDEEDTTYSKPIYFTSSDGWTGWERVYFVVQNPLGGSAIDSMLVFSVPDDGSPVVGGLDEVRVRAGFCDSLNIDLDDYYYDYDTKERFMTWSVSGNDSITVNIDPSTHSIKFCAPSLTFEGQEIITLTVSDGVNSDSVDVTVIVYGAVIGDVFSMMMFRNPMQGDYMDIYISSEKDLIGLPALEVRVVGDTTVVNMEAVSDTLRYYHGIYLLPYDASLGIQRDAVILADGTTLTGKVVQDTLGFTYGRFGPAGGKIALGLMTVNVPENALKSPEMFTLVANDIDNNSAGKSVVNEVSFSGDAYTLGPVTLDTEIPMGISFSVCCRSDGAGIYKSVNDGWEFVGSTLSNKIIYAKSSSGGTYRLGYDRIPPKIELISSEKGNVAFTATDYGSGIDVNSIKVMLENREQKFTYNPERSVINIEISDIVSETDVSLKVMLTDRVGNQTVEFLNTTVEPAPGQFFVEQNVPNPFNPMTTITFINTSDRKVKIEIYDILGRKVRVLVDEFFSAGTHSVIWKSRDDNGHTVSNGIYLYRVITDSHIITRKMVLLK